MIVSDCVKYIYTNHVMKTVSSPIPLKRMIQVFAFIITSMFAEHIL